MKILPVLLLYAMLISCNKANFSQTANIEVPKEFSEKTTSFAFDFWETYNQKSTGNYFLSPLSLNFALGMLWNGTEGSTKNEIGRVLGFDQLSKPNEYYAEIIKKLPKIDPKVTNLTANSVWYSNAFTVEDPYLKDMKKYFDAEVNKEDFGNATTVKKINDWASKHTNNKIEKIIDIIEPNQVLFLINTLYFKGDWTHQFVKTFTQKDTFFGKRGETQIDFMTQTEDLGYTENEAFQMAELPYGNEKFSLIVLLPKSETFKFSEENWNRGVQNLTIQEIKLILPKFKLESSKILNEILKTMGIAKVFTSQADLSGISNSGQLLVNFVKQDTFLSVDEKGSEAAAVTTISTRATAALPNDPLLMKINKPFYFSIVEKTSGTIQFFGKVEDLN